MAGKRLVDAALLLNATSNIAKQHAHVRSEQLNAWSRTSTIAKAVQTQTDRVVLTAQAAAAIAHRLNEEPPSSSRSATQTRRSEPGERGLRPMTVQQPGTDHISRSSLKTKGHGAQVPLPPETEAVESRNVEGPIPENFQQRPAPGASQQAEPDQVPEDVNTDVFHTRKGRQMLGGYGNGQKPAAGIGLGEPRSIPAQKDSGDEVKGQETFDVRMSKLANTIRNKTSQGRNGSHEAVLSPTSDESVHNLAADIALDQSSARQVAANVR